MEAAGIEPAQGSRRAFEIGESTIAQRAGHLLQTRGRCLVSVGESGEAQKPNATSLAAGPRRPPSPPPERLPPRARTSLNGSVTRTYNGLAGQSAT
jgi:hypothetical protein